METSIADYPALVYNYGNGNLGFIESADDVSGAPQVLVTGGKVYYYITNLQGDGMRIESSDGFPMHTLALKRCIKRHRSVTSVGYTTRANDTMKAAGDKMLTGYVRQSFG